MPRNKCVIITVVKKDGVGSHPFFVRKDKGDLKHQAQAR